MSVMSFFVCIHYTVLLDRACWVLYHLCSCLVAPGGACTKLACRYCWQDEGWTTRRQEKRGGLKNPSLCISTTSDPARAGRQTCKGLTWQLRPPQPTLAVLTWRSRQCSRSGARSVGGSGAGPPQHSRPCGVNRDVIWGTRTVMIS